MPLGYKIEGVLSSTQLNDTVITNRPIKILFLSLEHPDIYNHTLSAISDPNGNYEYEFENLELLPGRYKITVTIEDPNFSGLTATEDLFVLQHPLSAEELGTYLFAAIGAALAIFGGITRIPNYLSRRKSMKNMKRHLMTIRRLYEDSERTPSGSATNELKTELARCRIDIMKDLADGKISESQYKLLDEKIAGLVSKM